MNFSLNRQCNDKTMTVKPEKYVYFNVQTYIFRGGLFKTEERFYA